MAGLKSTAGSAFNPSHRQQGGFSRSFTQLSVQRAWHICFSDIVTE